MSSNLAKTDNGAALAKAAVPQLVKYTPEQIEVIKTTVCRGASNVELALFIEVCQNTGLNPFIGQIWAIKRYNSDSKQNEMAIQVGISGLRLVADRTGKYVGQKPVVYCGPDGQWTDVWLLDTPPAAARCAIFKEGFPEPMEATILWKEFAQMKEGGIPIANWKQKPSYMLAKCAEAAAFRKAFPQETSSFGGVAVTDDRTIVIDAEGRTLDQSRALPREIAEQPKPILDPQNPYSDDKQPEPVRDERGVQVVSDAKEERSPSSPATAGQRNAIAALLETLGIDKGDKAAVTAKLNEIIVTDNTVTTATLTFSMAETVIEKLTEEQQAPEEAAV